MALRIHLATFNCDAYSIHDQVLFMGLTFRALGFEFSHGPFLRVDALNVMIEVFTPTVCQVIEGFYRKTGKRISIYTTEHLDFVGSRVIAYNHPLFERGQNWDYVGHEEREWRFSGMLRMSHVAHYLIRQCEYPRLKGVEELFPRNPIIDLPVPPLPIRAARRRASKDTAYDFVFTGSLTPFRKKLLSELQQEFKINTLKIGVNFVDRIRAYLSSSLALNIPQYEGWIWSSPMRILYGLATGRQTVSVHLDKGCSIDDYTHLVKKPSIAVLREIVRNTTGPTRVDAVERYQNFAESDLAIKRQALARAIESWAELENLL